MLYNKEEEKILFQPHLFEMLFTSENYPVAFRILADLGFAARTTNGRSTLPNLMGLLNVLLPKDQETYDYAVSLFCVIFLLIFSLGYSDVSRDFPAFLPPWFSKDFIE